MNILPTLDVKFSGGDLSGAHTNSQRIRFNYKYQKLMKYT